MLYGEGLGYRVRYIRYVPESIGCTILPKVNILRQITTLEDVESPTIEQEKTNKQKTRSLIFLCPRASKPMPLMSDQNTTYLAIAEASRSFGN